MIRILLILAFLVPALSGSAQLLKQSVLDTIWNYESLEEALQNPEKVVKLTLRKAKLKEVPAEVFEKFPNLQVLNLSKNKLTRIPAAISKLQYLQELDVSANMISEFPDELCELPHLRKLSAGRNELSQLPGNIGNLKELEYLDLWSNNLRGLPNSISDLGNLQVLDLRVIQFSKTTQDQISELLPNTTIHFSQHCNCD